MRLRFQVSGKRILVSSLVALTLVAAMAAVFVVPRHNSKASSTASVQHLNYLKSSTPVHGTLVTQAQLAAAKAASKPSTAKVNVKATNRPFNGTKAGGSHALPQGVGSAAPTGTNLYGNGKLPVLQGKAAGLDSSVSGGWYPPDQAIANSASYTVEAVNDSYEVYNTTFGAVAGPYTAEQIFSSVWHAGSFASDPQVTYDGTRKVYLIAWLEVNSNATFDWVDVAVTTSPNPVGISSYFVYQVSTEAFNADRFCDYPTLGYDWSGMYVSCVAFSNSTGNFLGNDTLTLSLDAMTVGAGFTYYDFMNIGNSFGAAYRLSPAMEDGVPQAEWIVTSDAGYGSTTSNIITCALTNTQALKTGGAPTGTCIGNNMPLAYDDPVGAVQPGTTSTLYPGFGFKQIAYRAGKLYFAMPLNINCAGHVHDGIYWAGIVPQLTTFAAHTPQWVTGIASGYTENNYLCYTGGDAFMPTLMATTENDLAMVYNFSSSGTFPTIVFTGRANTDAPGTMGQGSSQFVLFGSHSNDSTRWGDYSACALSPVGVARGILFCGGEFGGPHAGIGSTGWDTEIYSLRLE
jgi:hypothetical protein